MHDVWLFNVTNERWRVKDNFVHALYPESCEPGGHGNFTAVAVPTRNTTTDGLHGKYHFSFFRFRAIQISTYIALSHPSFFLSRSLFLSHFSRFFFSLSGRVAAPLVLHQQRRRAPGWDGCRDRSDGRVDLPNKLIWLQPAQRAAHRSIYLAVHGIILMFGGRAYTRETLADDTKRCER